MHNCTISILGVENIHDRFFWWKFKISSDIHTQEFDCDELLNHIGFEDMFVDSYIKTVGSIINNDDN